jgi:menaquinone-specific isochorismate synthase
MTGRAGLARRGALVARTIELATEVDLASVAGQHGVLWQTAGTGMAGRGVAARVRVAPGQMLSAAADVHELLSEIDADGPYPPVAVGALPFSPSVEGQLIVPEVLVRRERDGTTSLTITGSDHDPDAAVRVSKWAGEESQLSDDARPIEFVVRSVTDVRRWTEQVADAARAVSSGRLDKVVLAREVAVTANRTIAVAEVVRRLGIAYPSCMVFAADGFVGASPELLVARDGERVRSQPLAGTAQRRGTPSADLDAQSSLLSSTKERGEHRVVVDAVAKTLARFCHALDVPDAPSLVPMGIVAHLGSAIEGRLVDPCPSALELASALHPTPAVAGTPTDAALAHIAAVEGVDRGRYAGPVGWVDAAGDGEWAVGIRSAELAGNNARLLAGAGIVGGSVAEAELAETELKLQAMLNAIVRP